MTLRIGVLGAAKITSTVLLKPARRDEGVQVTAVAARSPERAARYATRHGGGALMDLGCYPLRLVQSLLGTVKDVESAKAVSHSSVDRTMQATYVLGSTAHANIAASLWSRCLSSSALQLHGSSGQIRLSWLVPGLEAGDDERPSHSAHANRWHVRPELEGDKCHQESLARSRRRDAARSLGQSSSCFKGLVCDVGRGSSLNQSIHHNGTTHETIQRLLHSDNASLMPSKHFQ